VTSINNLKADHKNARKRTDRSADLIKESLERYGAARSIVIDEDNRILAGNGTVEGAKAAGIKNLRIIDTEGDEIIAIRRTGLSEDEKVGLALADNRTSDLSEWDQEMLHHLSKDHDLAPWFEQTDLDSLLEDAEAAFPELDDGDKQPFQQMAFTLHDDQAVIVQEALTKAKAMGNFDESINENSNGNALARVAELFLSWGSDHGIR
jgi:ParB family transcriptional regulator, chromosome partitioning protein